METNGGNTNQVEQRLRCRPEDVREALMTISANLSDIGVGSSDLEAIEVVLAECMNNVVEHAYADQPGGELTVKLHLSGESLFCRLEDSGIPMPGLKPPRPPTLCLSLNMHELPEGGFGWFLIRELASDLRYAREADRNRLTFRIPLGAAP